MSDGLRRAITLPAYLLLTALALPALPLLLPLAAIVDLARGTRLGLSRSLLFFTWYLLCETYGIVAAGALALARPWLSAGGWERIHQRLKRGWGRALLTGAERIFGLRFEVEGDAEAAAGPMLLFPRHASVADTVLAAAFLEHRHHLALRYVIKRELLWDPCLDLVGRRLRNAFVDRSGADSAAEIATVRALARDLGPGDGVLIYPEGTRFSEAKRSRILERLEARDADLHRRARGLRHVLPPRLGGCLALLEERPDADVVFCAHAGFDGVTRFSEFLDGGLVGQVVRIAFWRVPAPGIPREPDARIDWLFSQWARVDAWVGAHRKP